MGVTFIYPIRYSLPVLTGAFMLSPEFEFPVGVHVLVSVCFL
jgi:hypothetical protein